MTIGTDPKVYSLRWSHVLKNLEINFDITFKKAFLKHLFEDVRSGSQEDSMTRNFLALANKNGVRKVRIVQLFSEVPDEAVRNVGRI